MSENISTIWDDEDAAYAKDDIEVIGTIIASRDAGEAFIRWTWPQGNSALWNADVAMDVMNEAIAAYTDARAALAKETEEMVANAKRKRK